MTSLPEQFTAARKAQVEAGFDMFESFANQAFESASRIAALNLSTSRDTLERSARTATALFASRDPRELLMLGGHAEEQVRSLFSYGRELMNIVGGIRAYPLRAPTLASSNIETVAFRTVAPAPAPEPVVKRPEPEPVAAAPVVAEASAAEPVVVAEPEAAVELIVTASEAAPGPAAEQKAIAKAAGKGDARASMLPHPAAAPIPAADEAEAPKVALAPGAPRRKK